MSDAHADEEWEALLKKIRTNSVKEVDLLAEDLSERDARRLAEALEGNRSVRFIDLSACGIGDAEAEALANVLGSTLVQGLCLGSNGIEDMGARALAEALKASALRDLDLSGNEVGDEGAKSLAACLRDSRLTSLNLSFNFLGDEGVRALAAGIQDSPLGDLNLSENETITGDGVRALAAALKNSNIETLNLSYIRFGDDAGQALQKGSKDTAVGELVLFDSGCSDQTLQDIENVLTANKTRAFLLQMQAEGDETERTFTFRTAAGTVAAALTWNSGRPLQGLRQAIFGAMIASTSTFKLPHRHLRVENLRIVRPDGQLLDDGPTAPDLTQQLGDQKKRRLH